MHRRLLGFAFASLLAAAPGVRAQSDAIRSEFVAALRDAQAVQQVGPADVALLDEATLPLPQDYVYVPGPAAIRLLKAMGNPSDQNVVGVIFPPRSENWLMVIQFQKPGFVREDDVRQWNFDDLLRGVSIETERGDVERRKLGFPEIEVLGWAEKPSYDAAEHRLVWAVTGRDKGAPSSAGEGVNYNTYVLGRDGYFKLNLVADLKDLAAQKAAAEAIVAGLQYLPEKRYADFKPATDKAADFTVVALIARAAPASAAGSGALIDVVVQALKYVVPALVVVLAGIAFFMVRARKPPAEPGYAAPLYDDFPATEISVAALDEPTISIPTLPPLPPPATAASTADPGAPATGPNSANAANAA